MDLGEGVAVAILAGGLGSRLRPIVADRPKVLAEVSGRPFVIHLLDQLAAASIPRVHLLLGHGAQQVRDTLGDSHAGVALSYSEESGPLGTAGAVRWALPALDAATILLLNGDSFCDVNLHGFLDFHRRQNAAASLVLAWSDDCSRYGRVTLDEEALALGFHEKGFSLPGWINAGIYLLSRRLFERLPSGKQISLERELLPEWVSRPGVHGYRCPGRFLDIGTPQSYACAERFFSAVEPVETHAGQC